MILFPSLTCPAIDEPKPALSRGGFAVTGPSFPCHPPNGPDAGEKGAKEIFS